jgi:phosphonate transport system substrate-binding protein
MKAEPNPSTYPGADRLLKKFQFITLLIILSLFPGCGRNTDILRIGIVPSESPERLEDEFKLVKKYLENETGLKIKVYIPQDYRQMIKAMKEKKVDIGLFGPFSYVIAEQQQKLTLLLVRKNKQYGILYNSIIITRKDSGIRNEGDLRNKKIAFVNTASTSGYIIPRSFFVSRQIDIETYLSGHYFSGSHDLVIKDVISGKADAGAVSNTIYARLIKEGGINPADLRIIWKSGDIPGSPYAARADLDKTRINLFFKSNA